MPLKKLMRMKAIKILILFFTLTSCSFFQNKEKINSEGMSYNDDFLPNEVEVEVEKNLYVIDRNGGFLRDISNEYSPIIDTLSFGMPLEISAESENFYKIKDIQKYILKKQVGNIQEIKLIPSELNLVKYISYGIKKEDSDEENYEYFEKEVHLEKFITLTLINEEEYLKEKNNRIGFITYDSLNIKKKDGVIVLPCEESMVVYKDTEEDNEEEEYEYYTYVGQIESINKYILSGSYYEAWDAVLVDKKTGISEKILDIPYLLPDKKHMFCITPSLYEESTDFSLYSINEANKIEKIFETTFTKWQCYDVENMKDTIFVSKNGYLYVPVIHSSFFWEDIDKKQCQYLKIGLKK